jgi:hypothetical protein
MKKKITLPFYFLSLILLISLFFPVFSIADINDTEQKITASDGAIWDWFGYSVSIAHNYAICRGLW